MIRRHVIMNMKLLVLMRFVFWKCLLTCDDDDDDDDIYVCDKQLQSEYI